MKLSIAWIFDHIDADWKKQDIKYIVSKFNQVTAEIESFYTIDFDLCRFAICKILKKDKNGLKVLIPEWKKEIILPKRDEKEDRSDSYFMVCKSGNSINWAQLKDLRLEKDGLIPALDVDQKDLDGNWKDNFEGQDVIIEVDNKSITHRPDMWGHRGFAREIAAFMGLKFLPEKDYLFKKDVLTFDKIAKSTATNPISIEINAPKACKRFAGLYLKSIENRPCSIFALSRLIKVGVRPINGIVDLTNYLTLDWSQPVHAYNAEKISGNKIIARMAKKGEKLILLDESELQLTDKDLVIADQEKPLCLAGIMGGLNSVIEENTKSVFFESAIFDPVFIRRSALHHKYRTESSMRFEKSLDPNQNIAGILRFLKLAQDFGIKIESANEILSVGAPAMEKTLKVSHKFLEKRAGLDFEDDYNIIIPLTRLGFKVEKDLVEFSDSKKGEREIIYSITIPTFRSTKDIEDKEDILEEVVRFYVLERIKLDLPYLKKSPSDLSFVFKKRKIKNFFANSAKMMEQQNYVLYDEEFLKSVGLKIVPAAEILNPVSENFTKLLTSLLPGLFKNIKDNYVIQDNLRFFEAGRIWKKGKKEEIIEEKKVAGVFFEKRKSVDFYECKEYISCLFDLFGLKFENIEWRKINNPGDLWFRKYQSAEIYFEKNKIGIAGKVDSLFLNKLEVLPESDAFCFELDLDFLQTFVPKTIKYKPLSKYQESSFDLSFFVPLAVTTFELEKLLLKVDILVTKVKLIDSFEKSDWDDRKSLTFRLWLNDPEKTMDKEEIEKAWKKSVKLIEKIGGSLRS